MTDAPSKTLSPVEFVEDLKRRLASVEQQFDWQPDVEPARALPDRTLKVCPPPVWTPPSEDIAESRQIIRDRIAAYLEIEMPDHMLLIKSLPGTGKTTLAAEAIDLVVERGGQRVQYAGPRHDLFPVVLAKSRIPQQWYEWLPRQAEDEDAGKVQTCNYAAQIAEWLQKGYQGMDFCSGVCGYDYVSGRNNTPQCPYHAQKKRKERVIYAQHQHVTMGHPLDFHVLIGDESPLAAFCHEWRIPARWILPPDMDDDDPLKEVLFYLQSLANVTEKVVEGPALWDVITSAENVLAACETCTIPLDYAAKGKIYRAEEVGETPYFHLPATAHLLKREAQQHLKGIPYPHRVIVAPGHLTLLLRRMPDPDHIPPHVIWLDATGRPDVYRRIFRRRVEVVDAAPRMFGRIYQVIDRAYGKSITIKGGKLTDKGRQAESMIKKIIENKGYQKPSIISYKDFVDHTDIDAKQGHFYAARGTNEHEGADSIFILGAPQANIYDIVKLAKMIYFERDTAFKVLWATREQVYNYVDDQGQGRSYPISGFWYDPDLQAILETIREDEIIQAAHRGRPVNKPVDIWLITNIPIPSLPPDELLTMREIMGAPDGVDIFKWEKVQQLMDDAKTISISDITVLGIHRQTAGKYLDIIAGMPGWEKSVTKIDSSRGGRPKQTVQKRGGFVERRNKYSLICRSTKPPL